VLVPLLVCGACRPTARDPDRPAADAVPDIVVAFGGRADGSGGSDDPVDTIARGVELLAPGRTMLVKAGRHVLSEPIEVRVSGDEDAWIRIEGEDGAVIDARHLVVGPPAGTPPYEQDEGAFALRAVRYVAVDGLTIVHSHNAGITVRDSSHVTLSGNRTSHTFSSGIAVWDSSHVEIVGNEVIRASDGSMGPAWFDPTKMFAPHEALTVSGVEQFRVAHNSVHHGFKEGIDVKGDSKHGVVEGNRVRDMDRQGIYVDAWEGLLTDVEVRNNQVFRNRSGGIVISAEGEGALVEDIRVHDNSIVENFGSGVFITRFGRDGAKRRIAIHDNEVRRNGWGPPHEDISPYHWITGGLYLFSMNVDGLDVFDNVFVDNRGFQIGCSADYRVDGELEPGLQARRVRFERNVSVPGPEPGATLSTGWPRDHPDTIVPLAGGSPSFAAPEAW
jgi:parallel beta-helix repeat protein